MLTSSSYCYNECQLQLLLEYVLKHFGIQILFQISQLLEKGNIQKGNFLKYFTAYILFSKYKY